MATFIKGDAIANAISYKLFKKNASDEYEFLGTQHLGKQQAPLDGHIDSFGNWATAELGSTWAHTRLTNVNALADDENGHCVTGLTEDSTKYAVAFYSDYTEDSPTEKFVGGMLYSELEELDADTIRQYATTRGAKYVIFAAADKSNLFVNLTEDIFFDIRVYDYQGKLPSGETHYLVVKAIAPTEGVDTDDDGEVDAIYADSDYSNEVTYTVDGNGEIEVYSYLDNLYINSSSTFASQDGAKSQIFKVEPNTTYYATPIAEGKQAVYVQVKTLNNTVVGGTPDFATGVTERVVGEKDAVLTINTVSDCEYLIFSGYLGSDANLQHIALTKA